MDLNGDGHDDLLSGSYSRMEQSMAGLFQILWGKPDGTFTKASVLKGTDDEPLIIPIEGEQFQTENICTRPTAVDWDADGDLDLVVGNFAGSFYVFMGEGTGRFQPKPQAITSNGSPLKIDGAHSDPFVVDWDNDGDLDLLSGSSNGGVQWAENIAGAGKPPVLESFRTLIKPGSGGDYGKPVREDDLRGPASATRVWVDDVNSDGRLDILVGDSVSLLSPADGLSGDEFKQQYEAWQKAFDDAAAQYRSSTSDQAKQEQANKRMVELYAKRAKIVSEERTGFVWLYVQK